MDLNSPIIIKQLLAKYGTRPSKGMGQNFLVNKTVLQKIIKSAELKTEDTILEVGPGAGTLTAKLADVVKKVVAVEKDKYMCQILKETLKNYKNIEVINGDILKTNLELPKQYKLVANIPYYLTSPLIRKFLENPPAGGPPEFMLLMVQKEVAQRICASPPTKNLVGGKPSKMSILAVSVQFYAKAKIISYVSKNCFWPSPKIDSAIIKITPRGLTSREAGGQTSPDLFFKIVKAGFSQPRKQLGNNLSKSLKLNKEQTIVWLLKNGVSPKQRAETLSIDDWIKLVSSL